MKEKNTTLTIKKQTSELLGKLTKQLNTSKTKLLEELIGHMVTICDFNKEISNVKFSTNLKQGILLIWFTPRVTVQIGDKE